MQHRSDDESNCTGDDAESWMSVELYEYALEIHYYCLRSGSTVGANCLRSWELQGSNNGDDHRLCDLCLSLSLSVPVSISIPISVSGSH